MLANRLCPHTAVERLGVRVGVESQANGAPCAGGFDGVGPEQTPATGAENLGGNHQAGNLHLGRFAAQDIEAEDPAVPLEHVRDHLGNVLGTDRDRLWLPRHELVGIVPASLHRAQGQLGQRDMLSLERGSKTVHPGILSEGRRRPNGYAGTMRLTDLTTLPWPPIPWADGGKIPWNEPGFSERMLREHLTQTHDLASRRTEHIDAAVEWIDRDLLGGQPSRILDLGCGPGLYLSRLARLGHSGTGIDFSPASVRYAREAMAGLPVEIVEGDLRTTPFGEGYDLVAFLYSEFNTFSREVALDLLCRARAAGRRLVLEVRTIDSYLREEFPGRRWSLHPGGALFSDRPHLLLEEAHLDDDLLIATRFTVIDLETNEATVYGHTEVAYRDEEWDELLATAGWRKVLARESLGSQPDPGFQTLVAV